MTCISYKTYTNSYLDRPTHVWACSWTYSMLAGRFRSLGRPRKWKL